MKQLFVDIQPALLDLVGVIIASAITCITLWVRSKFKVDIEKKYQDDLHSAMMSGVKAALEKIGQNITPAQAVEAAILHAEKSVPEAMKALNPPPDVLAKIAVSKLTDAKALAEVSTKK